MNDLPQVLWYGIISIRERWDDLRKLWFKDPIKLTTTAPSILWFSLENIISKIEELKNMWFSDPITLIERFPFVVYLSSLNISNKIDSFRELEFKDPIRMITLFPSMLGLSIENNILPKVKLLDRFISNKSDSRDLLLRAPSVLGTKIDKTWIILRWLHMLWLLQSEETLLQYKAIDILEIESFILAVTQLSQDDAYLQESNQEKTTQLITKIRNLKKTSDKSTRKWEILAGLRNKIQLRYIRWYWK